MTSGYAHELIDIFFWEYTLLLQSLNDIREAIQIYRKKPILSGNIFSLERKSSWIQQFISEFFLFPY